MSKLIPLTQGKFATIDDEDYERTSRRRWAANKGIDGRWVAVSYLRIFEGGPGSIAMHRFILSAPDNLSVDHINHDALDNRKSNLRLATVVQNGCNRNIGINNTSGYKGVVWHKRDRAWQASIKVKGKRHHLGLHRNVKDAARAYNEAALKYHGAFAKLNPIED